VKKVTSIVLNNFTNDSRVLKENISLQKAGYDIKVVAWHDAGQKEIEVIQGIPVHRIKLVSKSWPKYKLVKLFKYMEFIFKVVKAYKTSDILHCNDLDALVIGTIIKVIFNKDIKIVYDAHEYETETNGLNGIQKYIVKRLEKKLIKYADRMITVSDSIAKEYVGLYNIEKPALVLNTPPYKEIKKKNIFREEFSICENSTIFLYQGGFSKGRGIEILLEVFKTMSDEKSVIVFMGYGPLQSLIEENSKEFSNIYYHEVVKPDVLLEYTSSANFGISMIEDTCLSYRYCLPNKIFEYLMAEIPVIVSDLYEMKKIVNKNKIGIVAKENSIDGLRDAINEAVKLNKQELLNNILQVKKIYNWEEQEKYLLQVYSELEVS